MFGFFKGKSSKFKVMPQHELAIYKHSFLDALEKHLKENNDILWGWYSVWEKDGFVYDSPNGQLFTGTVTYVNQEDKINSVCQYVEGLLHGFTIKWDYEGALTSEYFWVKGEKHGRCLDWSGQPYEGRISYDRKFEHGKCLYEKAYNLDGTFREYFFDS